VEIPLEAVITALGKLVGYATQQMIKTLLIPFRCVDWFTLLDPFLVLPGNGVLSIGPVQSELVVVEDILLTGTNLRVNLG
jgi:hypothetical protein